MSVELFLFIFGLGILGFGAEWFIKGARIIAEDIGISPLIIGLTLGALGTSLPELIVSTMAAVVGKTGISIGNVVGSNIANIGLALSLGALIFPVSVEDDVLKYDYWVLFGAGVLFYFFTRNLYMSSLEGIIFLGFFVAYAILILARHCLSGENNKKLNKKNSIIKGALFFIPGSVGLAFGARFVVGGATKMVLMWGVTETIIGITAVAIGTSLPEIAILLIGSIRKQPEISLGTIVGSNIINLLLILGLASVIAPITINSNELIFQGSAVILFSVILFPMILTGKKITRMEGLILLILYLSYLFFIL